MNHLAIALEFFVLSVVIHICYCRKAYAASLHAMVFILISVTVGLVMAVCFVFLKPSGLDLPLTAFVVYALSIPAYLVFYVSTFLVSPSKKILRTIQAEEGATREEIVRMLEKEDFVALRLGELQDSGCVCQSDGKFMLTPAGKGIARIFSLYRTITGRGAGG